MCRIVVDSIIDVYVLRVADDEDAYALHALLSSAPVIAWLDTIAEPARGGYRRYLGWTVATLPIPADWPRAKAMLAPLGRAIAAGERDRYAALTSVVASSYGLSVRSIAPLVEWLER